MKGDRVAGIAFHMSAGIAEAISPAQPAKADAISKMMDGSGTGKGLNVKGKSAKTGRLSGAVLCAYSKYH